MSLAASRYEVHYKSKGWRAWGTANLNMAGGSSQQQFVASASDGNSTTMKKKGSGKVEIRDLTKKRHNVVWSQDVDDKSVKGLLNSLALELEELSVEDFQAKWGIEP